MKLVDGTELNDVKFTIEFLMDEDLGVIEVHIDGNIIEINGWYSNVVKLENLSSILEDEDLAKVKFMLGKMNGMLQIR